MTALGIGAVTGTTGDEGTAAACAAGCPGLLTRTGAAVAAPGPDCGAAPNRFESAAPAPASCCSEAPQNLQNAAETSHAARQRGHARVPACGVAPAPGPACEAVSASPTGGDGGGSAFGVVPMASIGIGAMAGADGADGPEGGVAASVTSTWPHVMQKREPARFCAPQLGHAVFAAGDDPEGDGSRGGPN